MLDTSHNLQPPITVDRHLLVFLRPCKTRTTYSYLRKPHRTYTPHHSIPQSIIAWPAKNAIPTTPASRNIERRNVKALYTGCASPAFRFQRRDGSYLGANTGSVITTTRSTRDGQILIWRRPPEDIPNRKHGAARAAELVSLNGKNGISMKSNIVKPYTGKARMATLSYMAGHERRSSNLCCLTGSLPEMWPAATTGKPGIGNKVVTPGKRSSSFSRDMSFVLMLPITTRFHN